MTRTLQGLLFEITSPSCFRLAKPYTGDDTIDITYLGAPGEWCLFHERHDGDVNLRMFPSRDEAVSMIAQAFKNVGALR